MAVLVDTIAPAAVGTVLSGIGSGAGALASSGTQAILAAPAERGELFAVALVIAYLAVSVPAVIAGLAAGHVGLHLTALVYGLVVAALGLVALVAHGRVEPPLRSQFAHHPAWAAHRTAAAIGRYGRNDTRGHV